MEAAVARRKSSGDTEGKLGSGSSKKPRNVGQPKKQDPRCGVLTGVILTVALPKGQGAGGSVAGGGGMQYSHNLCIAVVDLNRVKLSGFGCKIAASSELREEEFVPLFSRDPSGSLSFNYCMVGEAIEGKRAKNWTPERFTRKMDCTFRSGDEIWAKVWTPGVDYKPGSVVTLKNVKLVKGISNNKFFAQRCARHMEFSPFFLNCDVELLHNHRVADLPLHAKLRWFWPVNKQTFPSAKEVAMELQKRAAIANEYSEANVLRVSVVLAEEGGGSRADAIVPENVNVEAVLERLKAKDLASFNFSGSTHLLCVDESECCCPSCDEYDPRMEASAVQSGFSPALPSSGTDGTCEKSGVHHGRDSSWDDSNFYKLNQSGYKASVDWPSAVEEIHVQPGDGKKPFVAWTVCASVAQWGYPGCEFEQDYVSPLDANCETDVESGLVSVAEGAPVHAFDSTPPFRIYDFKRVSVKFKLYNHHMLLGPAGVEDLEILMISHKVPFDVLLDLDFSDGANSCKTMQEVVEHLQDAEGEWISKGPTEGTAHLDKVAKGAKQTRDCAERFARESDRWSELGREDVAPFQRRVSSEAASASEGGGSYFVRAIAWRLGDYLRNSNGLLLGKAAAVRWLDNEVDGQAEEPANVLNPLSAKNDECFVYLNPKKFAVSSAPSGYEYYALVCYGNNAGRTAQVREKTLRELHSKIAFSKSVRLDDPSREAVDEELYGYLQGAQNQARIFLYAVDVEKMNRCKVAARTRDSEALEWIDFVMGRVSPKEASSASAASTTMTTATNPSFVINVANKSSVADSEARMQAPGESTEEFPSENENEMEEQEEPEEEKTGGGISEMEEIYAREEISQGNDSPLLEPPPKRRKTNKQQGKRKK